MGTCVQIRSRMMGGERRSSGFSLVELMVTVAVLAVIIAIATPSFTGIFNNNRLTSRANELVASLQMARSEALRRNARVVVCRSDDGGNSCAGGLGPWDAWITIDSEDQVLRQDSVKAPVELSADVHTISFRGDGVARDAAGNLLGAEFIACIPTTRPVANQKLIAVGLGGRVSVESKNGDGECP